MLLCVRAGELNKRRVGWLVILLPAVVGWMASVNSSRDWRRGGSSVTVVACLSWWWSDRVRRLLASSMRRASFRSRQQRGGVREAKAGQEIVVLGPEAALGLPGWRVTRKG